MDDFWLSMGYIILSVLATAFVALVVSGVKLGQESAPHRTGSGLAD